eukprot:m.82948 g.82948  ORF g.82948 m.82948 type:complete len:431 (-) comp12706_c0_seq2:1288-2580(-)
MAALSEMWQDNDRLLMRPSPLAPPTFTPCKELVDFLHDDCRVLVIGAGGLGCELLKDLALAGFRQIEVIDMDTIDLSNLNRQFLFRSKDIGRDKATVAAEFINKRVAGCNVVPHFKKIQEFDASFYRKFHMVICGLDSVKARRWINSMLVSLVQYDADGSVKQETVIPLIDGGTEGFLGNCRVILPGVSPCVECTLYLFPPQKTFPMCTLASTPRLPEHCIEYAKVVLWPRERKDDKLDGDNPDHVSWLYQQASERAKEFGIQGVTYRLTQGVVKNIIPNVASTSAVIAAACANEAFKLASSCCSSLSNYFLFNDLDGVAVSVQEFCKSEECLVCATAPIECPCSLDMSLTQLREHLADAPFRMEAPGITTRTAEGKNKTLYLPAPPALEKATRKNLDASLSDLGLEYGQVLYVTAETAAMPLRIQLQSP